MNFTLIFTNLVLINVRIQCMQETEDIRPPGTIGAGEYCAPEPREIKHFDVLYFTNNSLLNTVCFERSKRSRRVLVSSVSVY